jgi:hypothetical protein
MPKPKETTPNVGDQVKEAVGGMTAAMLALGKAMEEEDIQKGRIVVEQLTDPVELNFGKFAKKITYKTNRFLGTSLAATAEEGGADVFALSVKGQNGVSRVVEVGKRSELKDAKFPIHGNPESDFVLIVHGDQPSAYGVDKRDLNVAQVAPGWQFQFGSEKSLGKTFQGGEIEKIVAFTESVG